MLATLAGNTNCLSYLSIDRCFRRATLMGTLLRVGTVSLFVGFAGSLFLLLLGLPFFADLLEFYKGLVSQPISKPF